METVTPGGIPAGDAPSAGAETATPVAGYVHGHHESVLRSHRSRTAVNSAGYLLGHLRPGQRLLDVGCGPGTITADLARLVAPGPVLAIDTSAEVVDRARAELADAGITTARVLPADLYALDLDDRALDHRALDHRALDDRALDGPSGGPDAPDLRAGSFDVVHAHQVLQHLPDPVEALRRMARLCVPGGLVAARDADYAAMTWYPQLPELDEWLALYRRLARAAGGEPDAGRRLLSWARAAGLTRVTATASTWCYATPEARAWWGGLWADRIVDSSIARTALASGAADRADLERISAGWRRWAADEDSWFAVLHGEVLCAVS